MSELRGNEAQKEAIRFGSGPMMVLAGPGSGKTFVITERICYLIEHHRVNPSKILVITFTKAAAKEMQARFFKRMKGHASVNFGTFHAIFYSILKETYHYDSKAIITEREKKTCLQNIIRREKIEITGNEEAIELLLSEISLLKNTEQSIEDYRSNLVEPEVFRILFREYEKYLSWMSKVDFDDMVLKCRQLLMENEAVRKRWQEKFEYMLIDEFQDINPLQYQVVQILAAPQNNLFIVGDDDQSIYGFRGAKPELMLNFPEVYPEAKQILLNINYRSCGKIVEEAQKVICDNEIRFEKEVNANREQGEEVEYCSYTSKEEEYADLAKKLKIYMAQGQIEDCAIIMRTSASFPLLKAFLEKEGIPCQGKEKTSELSEHFIFRDLLAYLAFAHNDHSRETFFRIMNRPLRYISREKIREKVDLTELKRMYREKPYMMEILDRFQRDLERIGKMKLYPAINYIRKGAGYDRYLEENAAKTEEEAKSLLFMADRIQYSAKEYSDYETWERFLQEQKAEKAEEKERRGVHITTMHASKGLEYSVVFLPDCNEGMIPHKKAVEKPEIEEERRMFYVAMTRAKDRLILQYLTGNRENPVFPSRFLKLE